MTIIVNLIDDSLPVIVDDRTAGLGGSFFYEPLRPYSPTPLKWAWDKLKDMDSPVLFDVGASTGCYTLLAAHHPTMRVYAFEPVPKTAEVLRANVRLNGLEDRARVFECGISNYNGVGIIHCVIPEGGSGVSCLDGVPREDKTCIDLHVPVITLDTLFAEVSNQSIIPSFIKIDVEGGEKQVLEGAGYIISHHHSYVIAEYEPQNTSQYGYNPEWITNFLTDMGYEYINPEGNDIFATWKGAK